MAPIVRRQRVMGTPPAEPRSGTLFVEATYPKEPEPLRGGLYGNFTVRSYGAHLSSVIPVLQTGRPYGTKYTKESWFLPLACPMDQIFKSVHFNFIYKLSFKTCNHLFNPD